MEISNKGILLFIATICVYVYLADIFNKKSVHEVNASFTLRYLRYPITMFYFDLAAN